MSDALKEIQDLYQEALDASQRQRDQVREDLEFTDPSDPRQWDKQTEQRRLNDPGGARPCLVLDQLGQYVANVAGQVEQRPPALHAIPVGSGADKKVAESLDGFFRHIEHTSRAQQHYARALTASARAGVGYIIVRPEYTDRALNYQEPRIFSEPDPLRVVFDPWSTELDGSDATMAFLLTPLSHREFERQFGEKKAKSSFGSEGRLSKDERESVVIAEAWRVEDKKRNIVVFIDINGEEVALPEDDFHNANQQMQVAKVLRNYNEKYRCVKWGKWSGTDALEEEREYPASGIGIVPVYGYVGHADNRMTYCGIGRRARHPQQAYNFHISEIRAYMNSAPKAPWIAPARALKGYEAMWDRASVENRATLPYNDIDDQGQPINAPQRAQPSINLTNHMAGAEQALKDIQAAVGMYQANLGAPSNETSGIAIENRKEQGEASTAHFPAHLAASLGQVGKLIVEMIPKLIDTRRQVRVLGIDMTPGTVVIDPGQEGAIAEQPGAPLTINPNVGRYDVRVVVGASFSTQRQQAQTAFTEMMRANPNLMPAVGPLWAQTLDVPNADKLAQVLTAVAPPEVRAVLQPEQEQETTAQLKAQNEQLKAALQEAISVAQEAEQAAQEAALEAEEAKSTAELNAEKAAVERDKLELEAAKSADQHDLEREKIDLMRHEKLMKLVDMGRSDEMDEKNRADQERTRQEEAAKAESEPEGDTEMSNAIASALEQLAKSQQDTASLLKQVIQGQESIAKGQQDLAKGQKQLIRVIQAPRRKEILYDEKGEPKGARETLEMPPGETLQ